MLIELVPAPREKMSVIQNMARFYVYDLSKSCGFYLFDWDFPADGLYEAQDLSKYWEPDCHQFFIRVDGELAGFALIDKAGSSPDVDWNLGEFFVVGKYQGKGVGKFAAIALFNKFPGTWEVMQMPPNLPAIKFWKKVIAEYSQNNFVELKRFMPEPEPHENPVLRFVVENKNK